MKLSLVLKYLLLLGWLVFAINEQLYAQTPKLTKDEKAISKHFSEIKKRMGVAGLSLTIHSIAECKGPDGAYVTKVESSEGHLTFKQQFSYRDEPVELKINGDEGVDAEGESISEFMIFFGRMHDYVRIALQPEYLFQEIDSVIQKKDEIKFWILN